MRPAVVITGIGVVTALGNTVPGLWTALLAGRSAIRPWADLAAEGFRVDRAARIEDDTASEPVQRALDMAATAARAAVADARVTVPARLAVAVGSTMGVGPWFEAAVDGTPPGTGGADAYAAAVAAAVGPATVVRAFSTACAAGNYAIDAAARLLADDRVDIAVAGGVDAFSRIAMTGFTRSRAMDPNTCRPFDAARSGMQLGEGAAFLVLERADDARSRGARAYARVHAVGLSCDAYHATTPRPDGAGMAAAMRRALALADVAPADVGFICAHGSGTRASDAAEAAAIAGLFGTDAVVGGIKGALAHAMGAASAIEAAVSAIVLREGIVPPTVGTTQLDPTLAIDLALASRPGRFRFALNNAFGFGGINSSLLLEAA